MRKKYLTILVVSILIITIGVTLAYFKPRIFGNDKEFAVKTTGVYIKYEGEKTIPAVSIEPGWNTSINFKVKSTSKETETYDIYVKDLLNTFVTEGYLQYKITSTNGFNMEEYIDLPKTNEKTDVTLAHYITINPKDSHDYTISLIYKDTEEDQSADMGKKLSGTFMIKEGTKELSLVQAILRDNPTVSERTSFNTTNNNDTTGTIYKTNKTEDRSDIYYYSGNTTNNWIKFGGYFWRIIRTNEDGSVRLLYAGTNHNTTEGYIGNTAFNSTANDPMYVGYMYGTSGSLSNNRLNSNSSTIKQVIDNWYQNNLLTNYDKFISKEAIYCSDRSISSEAYSLTSGFHFGDYYTLVKTISPSYKCGANTSNGLLESTQSNDDKFSASISGGGNGDLDYPIALMTADEIVFAGGLNGKDLTSPYAWYYTNSEGNSIVGSNFWWTLTPYYWSTSYALNFTVRGSSNPGYMTNSYVNGERVIRPVISLSSNARIKSGDATANNPYEIDEVNYNSSDNTKDESIIVLKVQNGKAKTDYAVVNKNQETSFIISPNEGYKLEYSNVSCTGTAVGTITSTGVKISNPIEYQECTVILRKKASSTLAEIILQDNPTISSRTSFSSPFNSTTTGTLFTSTESIAGITSTPQEVYYYAGNTTNNWVLFGGFYWRIIRTNHDGSIRLLYVGTSHDTTSGNIGTSAFNTNYNSPKYVGYKYGEDTSLDTIRNNTYDSTIKTYIDTWYQNNLTNYTKYLSTSAIYCNDRSEETEGSYTTSSTGFDFASHKRLITDKTPTYNCSDIRDAFSVENTSARLDYPVALMTADEMAFAGGTAWYASMSTPYAWFISNSSGTKVSNYWWSLSPFDWFGSYASECYWDSGDAGLGGGRVSGADAVRPVISLNSCVKVTGKGTADNPYVIDESASTC